MFKSWGYLVGSVNNECVSIHCDTVSIHCRFLVDTRWFKQWKRYVGYDTLELKFAGKLNAHPGPIDNSSLLKCKWNFMNYELFTIIISFRLNSGNFNRLSHGGARLLFIAQTSMGLFGLQIWPFPWFTTYSKVVNLCFHCFG